MLMNYNVFSAAKDLGLKRVVWASSETTLGLPFSAPPRYAPVDEAHYPVPESSYALSKVASETVAEQVARWSGVPFVALRFSNILGPSDYANFSADVLGRPARRANGTSGAISTNATWRSRVVWASAPMLRVRTPLSSPPPIR